MLLARLDLLCTLLHVNWSSSMQDISCASFARTKLMFLRSGKVLQYPVIIGLWADNSVRHWWNLSISNPKQISFTSVCVPSLVKVPWHILKSGKQNMDMSWADSSVKIWRNLPISNPKPDLHNINAYTKFGENPLMFIQVIIQKQNMDGQMTDRQTHGRPTWKHNTLPLSCDGVYKLLFGSLLESPYWSRSNEWCFLSIPRKHGLIFHSD